MSVLYRVIPAGKIDEDPFALECLHYYGLDRAPVAVASRNPTPHELRTVLDRLPGYQTDYLVSSSNWQAGVEVASRTLFRRSSTLLTVLGYRGNETSAHEFYFDHGDPALVILIVERLSRVCGPFYVFLDAGARPLQIVPGIDPVQAARQWHN